MQSVSWNKNWKRALMVTASKVCPTCGESFSQAVGKGLTRKYCDSIECYNKRHLQQRKDRHTKAKLCPTEGCTGKATRISAGVCEMCYYRLRRNGTTAIRTPKYRYSWGAGYIRLHLPEHPLADGTGNVFEHRKVMWEATRGHNPYCFWCGEKLNWEDSVVIDHLDEDKVNNDASNLVISCNRCNLARGAMLPYIRRLRPEAMGVFMACIRGQAGAEPCHDAKTGRGE